MSYTTGPAGRYREHPRFDDAVPLERQLAARRDARSGVPRARHVSAAYLPYDGFGDVSAWKYPALHVMTASAVYVVRLKCTGLPLADGAALLLFIRALGLNQTLGFDVRGAAAWQDPGASADAWWVDLICTVSSWGIPSAASPNDAANIASNVGSDASLRASFPNLVIDTQASYWGELTAPPQSVDFWKSQPILWDHSLPGPNHSQGCIALFGGCGGPTNTFAAPPASSIVQGKADDGAMAIPFPVSGAIPITVPGGTSKDYTLGSIHVAGVLAIAAGLGLGYYYLYGRKGHGR